MRKEFSTSWKGSKKPRKQRKYLANAPIHLKRKFFSSTLSEELRKKYSRRSFVLRKGDEVKVLRGKSRGKTGKVDLFNDKKMKVTVTGLQFTKKDGSKINILFHPSKLEIISLVLEDKKRIESIAKDNLKPIKEGGK